MEVLALTKRWQHHTTSGGYDKFAEFFASTVLSREEVTTWAHPLARKILSRFWSPPTYLLDYRFEDLVVEHKAFIKALTGNYAVVHCLYGDEQLNHLLEFRRFMRAKLVASFHLPWYRTEDRYRDHFKRLDKLDGLVAVSNDLAYSLSRLFGEDRVRFIPHGIDTDVFRPATYREKPEKLKLLIVGFHMRDVVLINRLIGECYRKDIPVDFNYVGPKESWSQFESYSNLKLESDLSEQELIARYQSFHALLLPVTSSTANNSLLEGLSCGLPVISTQIGGIPDYLDSDSGWLLPPNNYDALLELVVHLSDSPHLCREKERAARTKAENFAWPVVAAQLQDFYAQLINT